MRRDGRSGRMEVPTDVVARLMVESRSTCNLCWRKRADHVHHLMAVADGGGNSEDNLMILCTECHSEVHTTRHMARNLSVETLRLYKAAWLDLVQRFPIMPQDAGQHESDIGTIRGILKQADRRALYYPLDMEVGYQMFMSVSELRAYIQSCGYRLLRNEVAKEHVRQAYKSLLEIEQLSPMDPTEARDVFCLPGFLGRRQAEYLEVKRKAVRFHLNCLAEMIGLGEFIPDDEFGRLGIESPPPRTVRIPHRVPRGAHRCFGQYGRHTQCGDCEYVPECKEFAEQK
jgi:hypothetical protein